jgi:acetyl-CoA carboxylase carboxyltransferase component
VISRFHGGAFVVFSRRLNPDLETIALEGSHASVIGGAPAAAVVFAREVDNRTREDERIDDGASDEALYAEVRSQKLGELAAEFDAIHSVGRAVEVGSVDRIISAGDLRPHLIETVERGIERTLDRAAATGTEPVAAG